MIVRSIPAVTHGRYLVETPRGDGVHPLIVGFHGYGEAAESSLDELRLIAGADRCVLAAIQALHPFYRKTDVVASWMTKLDRERAIRDNIAYVGQVVTELKRDFHADGRLVYVGFSQGVAMAYRAAAAAGHVCHGVIVLAGDVPPELGSASLIDFPPVLLGRGRQDQWYSEQVLARDLETLRAKRIDVEALVYDGEHEWTDDFRQAAAKFLQRVLASTA